MSVNSKSLDDSVPQGENMPPRFSILQSENRVRTYAVLDRIDRVVAFTAYVNRAVEILKDAQFNPSQSKKSWCWTPFTGIHQEKYTEMTEEDIRLATQTIDEQEPRYAIVQADANRHSCAVWDRVRNRMAPVTTLTRVIEMQQQCVDGKDNHYWITVDNFEKSYGAWSVVNPLSSDAQTTGIEGKSPAGVFTSSPCGTGSCVGASAKPSGHRQLPITSDDATQQFSMATVVGGQYRGRWAIIYVEFADGLCLVELDQKQKMEEEIRVIHRDFLLIWATCLATAERKE